MPTDKELIIANVKNMEAQGAPREVIQRYLKLENIKVKQMEAQPVLPGQKNPYGVAQPVVDTSRGLGMMESFMQGSGSLMNQQKALAHRFGADNVKPLPDGDFAVREWGGEWFTANKPGADASDIMRHAADVGEMAGGTVGSVVAPLLTKNPYTIPAGEGIGASVGRGAVKGVREFIGGPGFPTTGVVDAAKEMTTTAGVNALAPAALHRTAGAIARAPKKVLSKLVPPDMSGLAGDLAKGAIPPSADLLTDSAMMKMYYNFVAELGGGRGTILKHSRKQLRALKTNSDQLVRFFGGVKTHEEAGNVVFKAAPKIVEKYKTLADTLYSQIADELGPDTFVNPTNTVKRLLDMAAEARVMPKSNASEVAALTKMAEDLASDAGQYGGAVPFKAFKAFRGKQFEKMTSPLLYTIEDVSSGKLSRIYKSMTEDIEEAILSSGAGEETLKRFRAINSAYTKIKAVELPLLEKIQKSGSAEAAYDVLMEKSAKGGTMLRQLKKDMSKKEWGAVAGFTLAKLGKPSAIARGNTGVDFSARTFITNWGDLAPEAKDALFHGTEYAKLAPSLNRFVRTVSKLGNVEKLAGSAIRSRGLYTVMILAPLAGYSVGLDSTTMAAMAVGPYASAKLMTSPAFIQWLTGGVRIAAENPSLLTSHIARLTGIAAREPSLEQELLRYQMAAEMQQKQMSTQELSK